ncbi:hypothetical protein BB560_000013 [Smittium megazygosporum]|uniref:Uncharacterized protein n=1 Tax=Smittium megazygosporum TaxID=133381 RepID=A0A2T9ZLN5_9FUNG|nr:hypothetical protein BB560_000013 [Smittium megazygosporum]
MNIRGSNPLNPVGYIKIPGDNKLPNPHKFKEFKINLKTIIRVDVKHIRNL